jgi:hypothetical protein
MDRKTEKLLKRVEKAGVRRSLKTGHVLDRDELLAVKVQVLPDYLRIALAVSSVAAGVSSYLCWTRDAPGWSGVLAILAFFLFLFAVFGIKRTLSKILENLGDAASQEILGAAIEGIFSAVGSIFDGA